MRFIQKIPRNFSMLLDCELPRTQDRQTRIMSTDNPFINSPLKGMHASHVMRANFRAIDRWAFDVFQYLSVILNAPHTYANGPPSPKDTYDTYMYIVYISYVCQYFTVTSIRNWFWNSFLTASLCSFLGNMQTVFGGYVNKNSWYAHYKALNSTRHNSEIFCRGVRDAHMNPRWGRYSWARYRYENLHTDTYIEIFHTKFLLNTECESTSAL